MPHQPPTAAFLQYLADHPLIRDQIRAAPGRTLLYAGSFVRPMWREISVMKRNNSQLADKEILPDVLARIAAPGTRFGTLLAYVEDVERQVPWQPDGFDMWCALSGIYASHASGAVSFQIGSDVTASKVFAHTEADAIAANPHVDARTKDLVAYYQRCILRGESSINVGFIA